MTKQVRIGMAGTSWYTDLMHLPALVTPMPRLLPFADAA
jgi:hypothetical protein